MIHANANRHNTNGFTLVEVLLFVTLISLIFITFSALTATSINKELINEHKILASHYSEELREWIQGQKEIDWDSFISTKMGTWCFTDEPVGSWPSSSGSCSNYGLSNIFKREAVLSVNQDGTQVNESISTSWKEGANIFSVPLSTILSLYE